MKRPEPAPCPHCGYCPTCGRGPNHYTIRGPFWYWNTSQPVTPTLTTWGATSTTSSATS